MANQANLLDQRLARIDIPAKMTRVAAEERIELARDNEQWWAHMVNDLGSSAVMLKLCCIDQRVFDEVYVLVGDIPWQGLEKEAIQTNRENSCSC